MKGTTVCNHLLNCRGSSIFRNNKTWLSLLNPARIFPWIWSTFRGGSSSSRSLVPRLSIVWLISARRKGKGASRTGTLQAISSSYDCKNEKEIRCVCIVGIVGAVREKSRKNDSPETLLGFVFAHYAMGRGRTRPLCLGRPKAAPRNRTIVQAG